MLRRSAYCFVEGKERGEILSITMTEFAFSIPWIAVNRYT